jgi:hypothetical protein
LTPRFAGYHTHLNTLKFEAHVNKYLYLQEMALRHICNFMPLVSSKVITAYYEVRMKSVATLCGQDSKLLHVTADCIHGYRRATLICVYFLFQVSG